MQQNPVIVQSLRKQAEDHLVTSHLASSVQHSDRCLLLQFQVAHGVQLLNCSIIEDFPRLNYSEIFFGLRLLNRLEIIEPLLIAHQILNDTDITAR